MCTYMYMYDQGRLPERSTDRDVCPWCHHAVVEVALVVGHAVGGLVVVGRDVPGHWCPCSGQGLCTHPRFEPRAAPGCSNQKHPLSSLVCMLNAHYVMQKHFRRVLGVSTL